MSDTTSPARLYAVVVGAVLVIAGIIGFFYNSTFTSNESVHDDVFGLLSVNGWHNVVHIATGLLGLAMARTLASSRMYALLLGVVYTVVAIWGFIIGSGESILSIVPINTEDSILHLAIAVVGFGAYAASAEQAAPATPTSPATT
jgi:hypothetical protein